MFRVATITLAIILAVLSCLLVSRSFRHRGKNPTTHDSGFKGHSNSLGGMLVAANRLQGTAARMGGELEFALLWDTTSDLDLSVIDPLGSVVDGYHSHSEGGGVLDVDANPTPLTSEGEMRAAAGLVIGKENQTPIPMSDFDGRLTKAFPGSDRPQSMYTLTPIEHIFFAKALRGAYQVRVRCFSWREVHRNPIPFMIQIRSKGALLREAKGTIGPDSFVTHNLEPTTSLRFEVP